MTFDDLERLADLAPSRKQQASPTIFMEPCPKCRGTGRFVSYSGRVLGSCFVCKGAGKLEYKSSAEDRAKSRQKAAARKESKEDTNEALVVAEHPVEYRWLLEQRPGFEFADSLKLAVRKYGSLTENQLNAIRRLMARDADRQQQKVAKAAQAREVDVRRIVELFATAQANQIARPKLRVGDVLLSLASPSSANKGYVYVKQGETYLGKISPAGLYSPSQEATPEHITLVAETAKNPLEQAIAYGRRTGNCSCCGRTLTNGESIDLGIGPICRAKWGM